MYPLPLLYSYLFVVCAHECTSWQERFSPPTGTELNKDWRQCCTQWAISPDHPLLPLQCQDSRQALPMLAYSVLGIKSWALCMVGTLTTEHHVQSWGEYFNIKNDHQVGKRRERGRKQGWQWEQSQLWRCAYILIRGGTCGENVLNYTLLTWGLLYFKNKND